LKAKKNVQFIFNELNPKWFLKYQENILKWCEEGKVQLISLPVQSGSQRVLDKMNRQYKIKEVLKLVKIIRKRFPKIVIKTQLIVGFPSETKEEFEDSLRFVREGKFFSCHLHPYSEYSFLLSKKILPKIEGVEIKERVQKAINFFKVKKIRYKAYIK